MRSRSGRRPGPPESQSTTPRSFSPATRRLPLKKSPCPNPRGHAGEQAVEPRAGPADRLGLRRRAHRRHDAGGARGGRALVRRAGADSVQRDKEVEALRQQGLSERRLRRRAGKERLERPAREDRRALGLEPRQQSHDGGGRPRGRERGERRDLAVELRARRPDRHPQQRCLAERQHGAATHGHPARAQRGAGRRAGVADRGLDQDGPSQRRIPRTVAHCGRCWASERDGREAQGRPGTRSRWARSQATTSVSR